MASPAASAPSIHILTSLPARPPTPPREASHDADLSLRPILLGRTYAFDPCHSLQTPPSANSHLSSAVAGSDAGSDPGSRRLCKRVEWSSHTEYKDPPDYRDGTRLEKSPPLSAPPSASSRPIKGILKPSPSPSPFGSSFGTQLDGTIAQPNLGEMLDSTIKQLAGPDRDSKLDAYMVLARALKTSNNLPDRVALQNKMSLFMQFIQRDITSKNQNGTLDSSLVNHALTLLATFLHFPAIASTITSDFGVFVIDHAIRSFEDPAMPKEVIRHLMQVVAFQNFSPKVMVSDRVGRLLAALHNIEQHLKGKSIVMSRLHIYKRLVKQARNCVIAHSDWLKDMFTDMLSTVKDIRAQAISLGIEAGFALRSDKLLFRKVAEIFKTADNDQTYIDFYIERLQRMIKDKQTASAVPQIWSVVILFLRHPLDRWLYYGPWLTIIQDAFNMTDGLTRHEANCAWNRYACLCILDHKVTPKTIKTLCQPLLSQLRRKPSLRQQDEAMKLRKTVLGGVCSLYYYAFAQGDDRCPTEVVWDYAVQPVMAQLAVFDGNPDIPGDSIMQAARMLTGLLDVSTPRPPRNPDRILDSTPLGPEELLPIDSKWIRRNCDRVFQVVGPVLEKKILDLANKESLVFRLWQSFIGSIAAASAKDIKVSEDTAKFLACTLSLLAQIWSKGFDNPGDSTSHKFLIGVEHLLQLVGDGLGVLPFLEKRLCMSTLHKSEIVVGPVHRSDKGEKSWGGSRTAVQLLFSILSSAPSGCSDDEELAAMFQSVFEPFLKGRNDKARAELTRELIQLLPRNSLSPYGPWLLAADNMQSCLEKRAFGSGAGESGSEKLRGPEYRELVSLLERGLLSHPQLPVSRWRQLFDVVSTNAFKEFGDAGRALVILEPLAKAMLESSPSDSAQPSIKVVQAMTTIFNAANLPRDRKALDTARMRLWGTPLTAAKTGSSDPFDNLYKLANHEMEMLYRMYADLVPCQEVDAFVEAIGSFFERCLPLATVKTISRLQSAFSPWIQDEKDHVRLHDQSSISGTLHRLLDRLSIELPSHGRFEKKDIDQIEPFMVAAFNSRHPLIMSKAVETWNALAKGVEEVECSESLKSILSSLRSKTDLFAPVPDSSNDGFDAQAPSAPGHLGDNSPVVLSSATSRHDSHPDPASASSASRRDTAKKRRVKPSPEASEKPAKRRSKSRPRHDDSQIQFTRIAPSHSPLDESQHLTAHQKEVRERQRENASLYPEMRSEDNAGSAGVVSEKTDAVCETDSREDQARDSTPKRNLSFDDMVRSTPTPRRGQVLPVDDANDPPSSPPVPRPYPLLPEIQSRSRANSSMDNWEFSSPPGSPVARTQNAALDIESVLLPSFAEAEPSPSRTRTGTRRQRQPTAKALEAAGLIPSSITNVDGGMADRQERGNTPAHTPAQGPATPPRRHLASRKLLETPRTGEDEFVDARSSPEKQSPRSLGTHKEDACPADNTTKTSFALSEGEEHCMVDLANELEARRREPSTSEADYSPKKEVIADGRKRSLAQAPLISPPGPTTRKGSRRLTSQIVPSTAEQATKEGAESGSNRKRKRSEAKEGEEGSKRRRSAESATSDGVRQAEEEQARSSPTTPPERNEAGQSPRMETRRSARRRRQRAATEMLQAGEERQDKSAKEKAADAGDTDEEVMSQLVTESFAASQQSESQESPLAGRGRAARRVAKQSPAKTKRSPAKQSPEKTKRSPAKQGSIKLSDATAGSPAEATPREGQADGEDDTLTIAGTLRTGLEQLRKAALTRDKVYELEDMLMDMKRELYEAEKRGRKGKQRKK